MTKKKLVQINFFFEIRSLHKFFELNVGDLAPLPGMVGDSADKMRHSRHLVRRAKPLEQVKPIWNGRHPIWSPILPPTIQWLSELPAT